MYVIRSRAKKREANTLTAELTRNATAIHQADLYIVARVTATKKFVSVVSIVILAKELNFISRVNKARGCSPNESRTKPKEIISTCFDNASPPLNILLINPLNENTRAHINKPVTTLITDSEDNSILLIVELLTIEFEIPKSNNIEQKALIINAELTIPN